MSSESTLGEQVILDLLAQLSDAIRQRILTDPEFDPEYAHLNPLSYIPVTEAEREAWERLTNPNVHEQLISFVANRRNLNISNYAKSLDCLLERDSNRRFHGG